MTEPTSRNPATQKQAKTWLTPEQIERIRDACLSETFASDKYEWRTVDPDKFTGGLGQLDSFGEHHSRLA